MNLNSLRCTICYCASSFKYHEKTLYPLVILSLPALLLTSYKPASYSSDPRLIAKWNFLYFVDSITDIKKPLPDYYRANITFSETEIKYHAPCNYGSAAYTIRGNEIVIPEGLWLTQIACQIDQLEKDYVSSLKGEYSIKNDTLIIKSSRTPYKLYFKKAHLE